MIKNLLFKIFIISLFYTQGYSQSGALDDSFGQSGKVVIDIDQVDNLATAVLIQADGKIILVGYSSTKQNSGYFSLTRIKSDGSVDETFGVGGVIETHFAYKYVAANSAVLQPDGKIIVAGYVWNGSHYDFALMRYTAGGWRDKSFGEGGLVLTDIMHRHNKVNKVVLQADGKIIVGGYNEDLNYSDMDVALARYGQDGQLDITFGIGGKVVVNVGVPGLSQSAKDIFVQPDGKILVSGHTEYHDIINDTYQDILLILRFNPNGTLDSDFGNGGIVESAIGTSAVGTSLTTCKDGKFLVLGKAKLSNGGYDEMFVTKYNANGSIDNSFGNNGIVFTSFDDSDNYGSSILMQPDQKILTSGYTAVSNGTTYNFALARYLPSGALDNTFGTAGKVTTDFNYGWDFGSSIALHKNGKIVVVGHSTLGNDYDFAVARYLNDDALPVKLETFLADKDNDYVKLSWQTSFESNSDYFEIQRSSNGKDWLQIGSKAAMHNSDSLFSYNFVDSLPSKNNLYRLKMVDADGTFAFSAVKSISFETDVVNQELTIFPNPADSKLTFKVMDSSKIDNIIILNSDGIATPIPIAKDNELDIEKFQPGVYHIVVNYTTGDSESRKIVIQ